MNEILLALVKELPFVVLAFGLLMVVWKTMWPKLDEKDKQLDEARKESLEAFKESVKVIESFKLLMESSEKERDKTMLDLLRRLDRIEITIDKNGKRERQI